MSYSLVTNVLINIIFILYAIAHFIINRMGDVMVSVHASVDRGLEPRRVKPNTIKLVFAASALSMQH